MNDHDCDSKCMTAQLLKSIIPIWILNTDTIIEENI